MSPNGSGSRAASLVRVGLLALLVLGVFAGTVLLVLLNPLRVFASSCSMSESDFAFSRFRVFAFSNSQKS